MRGTWAQTWAGCKAYTHILPAYTIIGNSAHFLMGSSRDVVYACMPIYIYDWGNMTCHPLPRRPRPPTPHPSTWQELPPPPRHGEIGREWGKSRHWFTSSASAATPRVGDWGGEGGSGEGSGLFQTIMVWSLPRSPKILNSSNLRIHMGL